MININYLFNDLRPLEKNVQSSNGKKYKINKRELFLQKLRGKNSINVTQTQREFQRLLKRYSLGV